MPNITLTRLVGCARCHGEGHDDITFKPLKHPVSQDGKVRYTHWAPCPTTGEPILMLTSTQPESAPDPRPLDEY